jgi:hypothetical protein
MAIVAWSLTHSLLFAIMCQLYHTLRIYTPEKIPEKTTLTPIFSLHSPQMRTELATCSFLALAMASSKGDGLEPWHTKRTRYRFLGVLSFFLHTQRYTHGTHDHNCCHRLLGTLVNLRLTDRHSEYLCSHHLSRLPRAFQASLADAARQPIPRFFSSCS